MRRFVGRTNRNLLFNTHLISAVEAHPLSFSCLSILEFHSLPRLPQVACRRMMLTWHSLEFPVAFVPFTAFWYEHAHCFFVPEHCALLDIN
jgi:hypothetical protein